MIEFTIDRTKEVIESEVDPLNPNCLIVRIRCRPPGAAASQPTWPEWRAINGSVPYTPLPAAPTAEDMDLIEEQIRRTYLSRRHNIAFEYLRSKNQGIDWGLAEGVDVSTEVRAALRNAGFDPDGSLVPLPTKLPLAEKPFVPNKFGEHD